MSTFYYTISKLLKDNDYEERTYNHYYKDNKDIIVKLFMLHHNDGVNPEQTIEFIGREIEDVVEELRKLKYIK